MPAPLRRRAPSRDRRGRPRRAPPTARTDSSRSVALGDCARRAKREPLRSEPLGGQLAVIGDRLAGGALVIELAPRPGCPRLRRPGRANRRRARSTAGSPRPPRRGRSACAASRSVVEEAQRDPAGVEMRRRPALWTSRAARPGRRVRRRASGSFEVEQLARDHAPLAPPLVRIDQRGRGRSARY